MLFKDFFIGTSFFGVLPIVLPFRKALVSPVLLVPKYGLKTQWLINGSHRKRAKKNFVTFLRQSWFFFRPWLKGPQGGCIGPLKKNLCNGPWNTENFAKMYFFQKVTPHFFYISEIYIQKLKLFAFWALQNSQIFPRCNFGNLEKLENFAMLRKQKV